MGKKNKNTKSSSTPGKLKGPNCQKSPLKTWASKDSKMYKKDPAAYKRYEEEIKKLN